jgi:heptosyltransferase-2
LGPPSLRAGVAAALARVPVRVGYRGDGRSLLLTHPVDRPRRGARHHADELRDLGDVALAALSLSPGTSVEEAEPGLLPGVAAHAGSDGNPPVWVFAPGTTYGEAKVWPRERAVEFAARAVQERGVRLVLLGDAGAAPLAASLAEGRTAGPAGAGVEDRTGRTTVAEAAAVLAGADAFVGNDSGLMHLAAAVGAPTVGLFGSTNPAWTAPRGNATAVVAADGFSCRPCYRRTCNNDVFCLATIDSDAVLAAIDALTTSGGGHDDLA